MKFLHIKKVLLPVLTMVFLLIFVFTLYSRQDGIIGRTASNSGGCASCHGGNSSSNTTLSINSSSNSFIFDPNSTNSFAITVANSDRVAAGINIAVKTSETNSTDAGTLAPVSNSGLKLSSGELTHTSPKDFTDSEAEFSFTWTAPSTPGTYYLRAIGNAVNDNGNSDVNDDWNWMSIQTFTVRGFEITSPINTTSYCKGDEININSNYWGVESINIKLKKQNDSEEILLAENYSVNSLPFIWEIPTTTNGGTYFIEISDYNNPNISSNSNLITIQSTPSISQHPESQSICENASLTISVETIGSGLNYQWKKDNVSINGANSATLNINSVSLSDGGSYQVEVTNDCGDMVISNEAQILVIPLPKITNLTKSMKVCTNENIELKVVAEGNNLSFQWYKNGSIINGQTNPNLNITNATLNDEGTYFVSIQGECGNPVNSPPITIDVRSELKIIKMIESFEICTNDSINIQFEVEGEDLTFSWYKNDVLIENNQSTILIKGSELNKSSQYYVIVSDSCGNSIQSDIFTVKILNNIQIDSQTTSFEAFEGSFNKLFVQILNDENATYSWFKDDVLLEEQTNNEIIFENITFSDSGSYYCIIDGQCNSIQSEEIIVSVLESKSGPNLTFKTSSYNFDQIPVGEVVTRNLENYIVNIGDENLSISGILLEGDEGFEVIVEESFTLSPGESKSILLKFSSDLLLENSIAELSFESNSITKNKLLLSASTYYNLPELSMFEIDFGDLNQVNNVNKEIELINNSNYEIQIEDIHINGLDSENFKILPGFNLPLIIQANSKLTIEIEFSFENQGLYSAALIIIPEFGDSISIDLKANVLINSVPYFRYSSLNFYPNPATEKLTIESPNEELQFIEIRDMKGKLILELSKEKSINEIDISNLTNGTYFISVTTEGATHTEIFMKVK